MRAEIWILVLDTAVPLIQGDMFQNPQNQMQYQTLYTVCFPIHTYKNLMSFPSY